MTVPDGTDDRNGGDDVVADLHLHTVASDGTCTLPDRVEQARERGLDAIAVTDHDRICPRLSARGASRRGVEVVAGVEVRADVDGTTVELLGYYVDPSNDGLATVLEAVRSKRHERNRELLTRLREETDADLAYEELRERVDGIVGRPHVAQALVDRGVVGSVGAAFGEYLGRDGTAFVEMERLPHRDVVDAIQSAGGVVSLAHPGRIRADAVAPLVERLADAGLDALEVWYPYGDVRSEEYAEVGVADARALADAFDLLATGGSDCHGPGSEKFRIGTVGVDRDRFRALRERAAEVRPLDGGPFEEAE